MRKDIFSVQCLPDEWDGLAKDNLYLKREFLIFLEKTEKINQSYHLFYDDIGALDSILVGFDKANYNLLMFTNKKINIKIKMFYFPLSVSRPSFVVGEKTMTEVAQYVKSIKGYKMLLNASESLNLSGFARGLTCPRCVLKVRWNSFDHYFSTLRSNYRYRFNKALKKSDELKLDVLKSNLDFSAQHYAMYEMVYDNSKTKLEKLNIEFFRDSRFKILTLNSNSGECLGFAQLLPNGKELIFEFVGFNHDLNGCYDIYMRLLLEIVREGIEGGYETIDFGQTADDAKLKIGCNYTYLYALLHNSNPLINFVGKRIAKKIQYKPLCESSFHVFKSNMKEEKQ